jgi:hypothetical protein
MVYIFGDPIRKGCDHPKNRKAVKSGYEEEYEMGYIDKLNGRNNCKRFERNSWW